MIVFSDAAGDQSTVNSPAVQQVQQAQADELFEQPFDLAGLYANDGERLVRGAPPRITECKTTEDKKAKIMAMLDRIFDEKTLKGFRIALDPEDVIMVLVEVMQYLDSEPMLIEDLSFGITVVGALHGQLHDLYRVFAHEEKDGKQGWECAKFLFLGDYVDGGRQSFEVVMALLCLKILYPDRATAKLLYFDINAVFNHLSVAAIIGNQYFCAHGGVTVSAVTRRQWKGIYKPLFESTDDDIVHATIWSEPSAQLKGATFNARRGTSFVFGIDILVCAMENLGCNILLRTGTVHGRGYKVIGGVCVSIFTATAVGEEGRNDGAVAMVDERGKLTMRLLEVDMARVRYDKLLRALDEKKRATTANS